MGNENFWHFLLFFLPFLGATEPTLLRGSEWEELREIVLISIPQGRKKKGKEKRKSARKDKASDLVVEKGKREGEGSLPWAVKSDSKGKKVRDSSLFRTLFSRPSPSSVLLPLNLHSFYLAKGRTVWGTTYPRYFILFLQEARILSSLFLLPAILLS